MNLRELQSYLNIPRDVTYQLVNNPLFYPAQKMGKHWEIDETALKRWIKSEIRKKDKYYGTRKEK